ncbi:MAG: hypothetical protein C0592_06095 [Marinilabiliales bacterium]|nr:MAG: hypothetical protein C0592_06095 [Marinilabiliales bacterium]
MKRYILAFAVMVGLSLAVQAQKGPYLKFEKLVHDFGELLQDDKAVYEFKFTNTGDAPLIISLARSSCGCTVPSWPRQPILPGESSTIKVKYDSHRIGPINKQVVVESNSSTGTVYLKITGKISKRPSEVMPIQNFDDSGTPFAQ